MGRFQWGYAEKLRTNRHTNYLGIAEIARRLLKVNSRCRYPSANDLVGKSGDIVRLKSQRRNAGQNGGRHGRARRIPTYSDNDMGIEYTDDLSGMKDREWKVQ